MCKHCLLLRQERCEKALNLEIAVEARTRCSLPNEVSIIPCRIGAPFQAMGDLSSKVYEQVQRQYRNETAAERHMALISSENVAQSKRTFLMLI